MKALSIRQPWAWFILRAGKDIENREWPTNVRGRVLIHASKGMTRDEYEDAIYFARYECAVPIAKIPQFDALARGGFVGSVEIVDCMPAHASPWFVGRWGFVLRNPRVVPFMPYKGALGFFPVDDAFVRAMESGE